MNRSVVGNTDGSVQWQKSAAVDSAEDSVLQPITLTIHRGERPNAVVDGFNIDNVE